MNCLCNIFEDTNIWVWIILILLLSQICGSCGGSSAYNGSCCH